MESKYGSRRKPASTGRFLLAALASFILGGILVGYVVWYNLEAEEPEVAAVDGPPELPGAALIEGEPSPSPTAPASASPSPLAEAVAALEEGDTQGAAEAVGRAAEQQGGLDQRLAAAEQRLARLDLQAQAAAGNAASARKAC